MKLLVTGATGQLARSLAACAGPEVDVITIGRPRLDLGDGPSITRVIAAEQPDIVVNAAAYTLVDQAESETDEAFRINAQGAGRVAAACAAAGVPIIHISTDYVFDGRTQRPYAEGDVPAPLNVYGRSKLAGEMAVAAACPRHVIVRTGWIFSPYGHNFVKTMLRLGEGRDEIAVVDDQRGTPTYAPHLASAIVAIARRLAHADPAAEIWGLCNVSAAGETTWCGLAREVFRIAQRGGGRSVRVRAIATSAYPTAARRPADSRLDTGKLKRVFGIELPPWPMGVEQCLAAMTRPSRAAGPDPSV